MTVRDAREILGARVLAGEEFLDREVRSACGSDMMSDVLAFSKDHSILITGLCNPQVIRTAEMLGKNRMSLCLRWQESGGWWLWLQDTACFLPVVCSMQQGFMVVRFKAMISHGKI